MAEFSSDWFSTHIPQWERLFAHVGWTAEAPRTALEIGSFEGRSAIWMLQTILRHPESRLYCLDTFDGGGIVGPNQTMPGLEARFRANIAETGRDGQVEVMRGPSLESLAGLLGRGVRLDLVYVDGSHKATDVLGDLVLGFRLLRPGGVMICDDYLWSRVPREQFDALDTPKIAVDSLTTIFARHLEILPGLHRWQLAFRKTAEA